MSTDSPRYFVDLRVGCVAVRDRLSTDPSYQGLHDDTEGVVFFKMGKRRIREFLDPVRKMYAEWFVEDQDVRDARDYCDQLNAEACYVD